MTNFKLGAAAFILAAFAVTSAHAADVPAPAPATKHSTLSLEFSPEWSAAAATSGQVADDYLKLGYSYSFDNNVVLGAAYQYTWRPDPKGTTNQIETSLGYKIKAGILTLTPSATLGYGFGDQPRIDPHDNFADEAYYAFNLAADVKLDDHWTWNAFNARYRNAFNVTWITPKISTGFTYKIDSTSALYANVGYAWKDKGDGNGLQPDKYNVAVGYKFSF